MRLVMVFKSKYIYLNENLDVIMVNAFIMISNVWIQISIELDELHFRNNL